jgi:hypothetical protein
MSFKKEIEFANIKELTEQTPQRAE